MQEAVCVRLNFETLVKGTDDHSRSAEQLQMLKCASLLFNAIVTVTKGNVEVKHKFLIMINQFALFKRKKMSE